MSLKQKAPRRKAHRMRRLAAVCLAFGLSGPAMALPTTSVLIENLQAGGTPPEFALVDSDGTTPLGAGTPVDGDGYAIALGYFSDATDAPVFTGSWTALTGPASRNIDLPNTSIGDSGSNASGPYGFFSVLASFDQSNPNTFQDTPDPGTRLAVAIYNGTTPGTSTHFNIATNDAWQWKAPSLLPDLVSINLNAPGTVWFGGETSARVTSEPIATFPGVVPPARLANISTRAHASGTAGSLIPGFVLAGNEPKTVLVRVAGPALSGFGVSGVMTDPRLRLVEAATGDLVATNDNWSDQPEAAAIADAFVSAGAFDFPSGSLDAALLVDLAPIGGGYTVEVSGTDGSGGVVIAEVYVLNDAPGTTRLVNISTRGTVGEGESLMIPGFAVGPGSNRRLLIRAAGPALGMDPFNLSGTLPDPVLKVYRSSDDTLVAENTNWEDDGQAAAIAAANAQVGAFALPSGTRDAALIIETPGNQAYTVQITSETGKTGLVIAEIYELP